MILHVAHLQIMHAGEAWCGAEVRGPHILGLDSFVYHVGDPTTGAVCESCIGAILDRVGLAIRKSQSQES